MRTRSWDLIAPERYWLWRGGDRWVQVDREAYIAAEREAGFHAPVGCIATAAFSSAGGSVRGTTLMPDGRARRSRISRMHQNYRNRARRR